MGFQVERDNRDNFVFIPSFSLCISTTFLFYCNFSTVTGYASVCLLLSYQLLMRKKEFFKLLEHVHKNWPQTIFGNML